MNDTSTGMANRQTFMDEVYIKIGDLKEGFYPVNRALKKTGKWRDKDPGIVKKVVFGAALLVSSLVFLIDSITSLALAIITLPLELFGIELARNFAERFSNNGLLALGSLSICQYSNAFDQKFLSNFA